MKTTQPTNPLPFDKWRAYISNELDKIKKLQTNRYNFTTTAKLCGASQTKNKLK